MYGYLDENKNVVPCDKPSFDMDDRRVGYDEVHDFRISTVFLAIDHGFGIGAPRWFETMIFPLDATNDLYCARYETYEEAQAGHKAVVEKVRTGELP